MADKPKVKLRLGPNATSFDSGLSNFSLAKGGKEEAEIEQELVDKDAIIQEAINGGHLVVVRGGKQQPVPGGATKGGGLAPGTNAEEAIPDESGVDTARAATSDESEEDRAKRLKQVEKEAKSGEAPAKKTGAESEPGPGGSDDTDEEDEEDDEDEPDLETKSDYIDAIKEHPKATDDDKKGLASLSKEELVALHKKINKRKDK